jgi:precorrin-6B methylase 2
MNDPAPDAPDKITRRRFVQTTGFAVAGSALIGVEAARHGPLADCVSLKAALEMLTAIQGNVEKLRMTARALTRW